MQPKTTPTEKRRNELATLAETFATKQQELQHEIFLRDTITAAVGAELDPEIFHNLAGHQDGSAAGFAFHFARFMETRTAADIEAILQAFPPLPIVLAQGPTYAPHVAAASHAPTLEAEKHVCTPLAPIYATIQPNGFGSSQPKTVFKYFAEIAGQVMRLSIEVNMYGSGIGHVSGRTGRADTYQDATFTSKNGAQGRRGYWGNSDDERRRLPEYEVTFSADEKAGYTPKDWAELMLPAKAKPAQH